ncbi:UNVERIFIED_CONTAM: hypothetical protein GTU68_058865 [Idotea baltica]|nr:hypothetical protein [Idotea baltica]
MQNLKPKKYLGQHFLKDQHIANEIVETLSAKSSDSVIEIGPGEGVLTDYLILKYSSLKVVEIDDDSVSFLSKKYEEQNLEIIHADVLRWKMESDIGEDSFFIGNLPYNISSPIFFKFMEHLPYIKEGVFMIQKEVADRICASPGNKTYGILSVLLGAYFDLTYEFSVPPEVFRPPPRVMSGVMRMVRKETFPDVPFPLFKRVVKQAFNQRRKTMRNSLKGLKIGNFAEREEWMSLRAEQLPWESFVKLAAHTDF